MITISTDITPAEAGIMLFILRSHAAGTLDPLIPTDSIASVNRMFDKLRALLVDIARKDDQS